MKLFSIVLVAFSIVFAEDSIWLKEPIEFRSAPFNCSLDKFKEIIKEAECYNIADKEDLCREVFMIGDCEIRLLHQE